MKCRSCDAPLAKPFLDLGLSPVANAYPLPGEHVPRYPLRMFVCPSCCLVQIEDVLPREAHFHEGYAYRSGESSVWREHCAAYAEKMIADFSLTPTSTVIEVGGNDGTLGEAFLDHGLAPFNFDPSARGPHAIKQFFGAEIVRGTPKIADLMIANNVLAHVPDLNDFIAGFAIMLKENGLATFEFPLLSQTLRKTSYDTVYHEHYSYLSLGAVVPLFERHGLEVINAERLSTHGGSVRVYVQHKGGPRPVVKWPYVAIEEWVERLKDPATYRLFAKRVEEHSRQLKAFLLELRARKLTIAAYGAPAKATTLLNYAGIGQDLIAYTVDKAETKQGRMIPGTNIPIFAPEHMGASPPDVVFILAWNIADEIMAQLAHLNVKFAVPFPTPRFL